jgi:hypothetical protein
MPLNKDVLGTALHVARNAFNDKTLDELIAIHGSLDGVRLAMAKADAEQIINHFKANAVITVTVATTGTAAAQTGGGTGTISS